MEKSIIKIIDNKARELSGKTVFRYKDLSTGQYQDISWKNFWSRSLQAARSIVAMGYKEGANIGIMCDNSPEWTICDIAIQASRGVVVPFFGSASHEQIKFIVEQTEMKLMFVGNQQHLESAIWALKNTKSLEKVVVLKKGFKLKDSRCMPWEDFLNIDKKEEFSKEVFQRIEAIEPNDALTILYTSGTTGDPKGVVLTHENFTHCFSIHDQRLIIDETDISLCFLPLSHVFERTWTFYMLYKGAKIVYLENPRTVIDEIKVVKPTQMCTVPRFFEKTYNGIYQEVETWSFIKKKVFFWALSIGKKVSRYRCKNASIPSFLKFNYAIADLLVLKKARKIFGGNIRSFPCSGAAIQNKHLRFFHALGLFINYGYGATETTATVSCFKPEAYDLDSCGSIMPEVEVKFSESGEILVRGKTVFKEYYKNPQATQQAIDDGWYKTGDSGHLTPQSDLVMTERINDIFKTSVGKFISPQKIELLLLEDVFIDQAVVFGDNRKYITALIIPSFEKFRAVWTAEGIEKLSNEELAVHPRVISFVQQRVDRCQKDLPKNDKIVKLRLLSEPFTIENSGLTNTLKIRRRLIAERYSKLIDEMYE